MTIIAGYAFHGCISSERINVPDWAEEIGDSAFAGSTFLESMVVPKSGANIGHYPFSKCSSLKSIIILNSSAYKWQHVLEGCNANQGTVYIQEKGATGSPGRRVGKMHHECGPTNPPSFSEMMETVPNDLLYHCRIYDIFLGSLFLSWQIRSLTTLDLFCGMFQMRLLIFLKHLLYFVLFCFLIIIFFLEARLFETFFNEKYECFCGGSVDIVVKITLRLTDQVSMGKHSIALFKS